MSRDSTELKPETRAAEAAIWDRSVQSKGPTFKQALQIFSDPACWHTVYAPESKTNPQHTCHWAWNGIVVPPYELAQNALWEHEKISKPPPFNKNKPLNLTDLFVPEKYCDDGAPLKDWTIAQCSATGAVEIEKIDADDAFHSDKEAAHFVTHVARQKSGPEALALLHMFSKIIAPLIELAQFVPADEKLTVTLDQTQVETLRRMRYL